MEAQQSSVVPLRNAGGQILACGWNRNSESAISTAGDVQSPEICNLLPQGLKIIQSCGGGTTNMFDVFHFYTLFLNEDGNVWGAGNNLHGQLGIGNTENQTSPIQISSLKNVVQVAVGVYHSLFLLDSGGVFGCGWNQQGQLGDETNSDQLLPVQVKNLDNVNMIACGESHSLFLKRDGTVWISGAVEMKQSEDGMSTTFPRTVTSAIQVSGLENVVSIASGWHHSLCLHSDGTVSSFGLGAYGQLGCGQNLNEGGINSIFKVQLENVVSLCCGVFHSVFLKGDSTCWGCGWNGVGQLGDGSTTDRNIPVLISSLPQDVIQTEGGGGHSLFVHRDGSVSNCGGNRWGKLGRECAANSSTPAVIPNLTNVISVGRGFSNTLYIVK